MVLGFPFYRDLRPYKHVVRDLTESDKGCDDDPALLAIDAWHLMDTSRIEKIQIARFQINSYVRDIILFRI